MMKNIALAAFKRECKLYARHRGVWLQPLLFFVMTAGIFAMVLGDVPNRLQDNAPGILWVGVLLSLILSQETVFHVENESGSLEALLLAPAPQSLILLVKIFAHSVVVGVPLMAISLFLALLFEVPSQGLKGLALSLGLGIPCLSLIGSMASALTVHLKRGGILLAILVLPLMAPVVLFGSSATLASLHHHPISPHISLLLAELLLLFFLAPITCLFALRMAAENNS